MNNEEKIKVAVIGKPNVGKSERRERKTEEKKILL